MSASLAVTVFSPVKHQHPGYRDEALGDVLRAQGVATIIRRSGYTTTQLSKRTDNLYGRESPYYIPPTLLYKIRRGVTPHICQVASLSECTGHRFVDWMRLFGFDLRHIPRLQAQLRTERTVLVTPVGFKSATRGAGSGHSSA